MASASRIPFFQQLYYQVALPRDVPGKEDGNLNTIEASLLQRMLDAVVKITPYVSTDVQSSIHGLRNTLQVCQTLNVNGTIGKSALIKEFRRLDRYRWLVLHIVPQNCGLLIYCQTDSSNEPYVVFEAFEASATADKILAATGALQWDFPGWAVSVPQSKFNEESFQDALATFLEQASSEAITKFAAVSWKTAAKLPEIRDTSSPTLISGLLMAILEANGTTTSVTQLRKRVRDTVNFDNARKPWRRSAFYLVLRVAIQRYLYDQLGVHKGREYYKTIMCVLHAQLLEDALKKVPLEAAFFLRQKLGRRLAKLSSDLYGSTGLSLGTQHCILPFLERDFKTTLATTGAYLKHVWRNFRQSRERIVPVLRQHPNNDEFQLRLTNSGRFLKDLSAEHFSLPRCQQQTATELLDSYQQSATSTKPYMKALSSMISASKYQEDFILPAKQPMQREDIRVVELSKTIRKYVRMMCTNNQSYPYQKSQQLLHIMELWVLMDSAASDCFPLLLSYHCGFDSDLLDPIELLTLEEMARAQEVRRYLVSRRSSYSKMQNITIFDDPSDDCFAVRWYDGGFDEGELSEIRQEIEDEAMVACLDKEEEWEEKSAEYEQKTLRLNEKQCVYDPVVHGDLRVAGSRHRLRCEWHNLHYELKNMRIRIFEHPLPNFEPAAKATIFELLCPKEFAAYRDATWAILSSLCHQALEQVDRISLVRDYSQLKPYANDIPCQVTLGSYQKAHLESHYATWGFPIALDQIIRICGLKPRYYDSAGAVWTALPGKASLWHHFPVKLAPNSPFSNLGLEYATWPTSNQIQASQAKCPQGLGIHEFTAFLGLLVGTHSRWIDLLRELGSTNLNFSSESTWVVVMRLVFQQGPSYNKVSAYTDVHRALVDDSLSMGILKHVRYRLEAIQRNWREPIQMHILVTILLKVTSLSQSAKVRQHAMELLRKARHITDAWRRELKAIIMEDSNVLPSAIWASLLCKRTLHTDNQLFKDSEDFRIYLDASISLHYNLSEDFECMPYSLRHAIVEDVMFAYDNRDLIERTLLNNPRTFITSLKAVWPIPEDLDFPRLELGSIPDTWWLALSLRPSTGQYSYSVHYNYLYGTLLIDGKEMGMLPLSYRANPTFRHLFGTKNPIVYPSPVRDMEFVLCETVRNNHRIHLAYRKDRLIVRTAHDGNLMEFIPHSVFKTDLPMPLVEGCYHWLHLCTGSIEIRQKDAWTKKRNNWWLRNSPPGQYYAVRGFGEGKQAMLLEPSSSLVKSITHIFNNFELPSHILVWVSDDDSVKVELKRMDLSFFINRKGLLESSRLRATVSLNQNCGTWYGLRNKIMIQSTANYRQKSILIPGGNIKVSRDGHHVSVDIESARGYYLKYAINDTLGRIECAPEPQLLYTKALLHAYTSHVIADPLTGRTGTEEALYLLQTSAYQPWNPLSGGEIDTLNRIAKLSPKRAYYPKDAKYMETVLWDSTCTIYMQDDRYTTAIAQILQRSSDLSCFSLNQPIQEHLDPPREDAHLATRALMRCNAHKKKNRDYGDTIYNARDTGAPSRERLNVLEISRLLLNWQPACVWEASLTALLHDAPVVGGYDKLYRKYLLSDHLTVDIRAEWGGLVQNVLQCNSSDKFSLMFLFSAMAFSSDVDLNLLRFLVSFAMLPEVRTIPAPNHAAYFHFRADGKPPPSYLVSLMIKARMPFLETGYKKRSQLVKAENLHGPNVDRACELLAASILEQWPSTEIAQQKLVTIDPAYLDIERALADITPEWTRISQNHELFLYLEKVEQIICRVAPQTSNGQPLPQLGMENEPLTCTIYPERCRSGDDMTLSNLLRAPIPLNTAAEGRASAVGGTYAGALSSRFVNVTHGTNNHYNHLDTTREQVVHKWNVVSQSQEVQMLREVVARFKDPSSFVHCRYSIELDASIDALEKHMMYKKREPYGTKCQITTETINAAKISVAIMAEHIRSALQATDPQAKWLQMVDLWPSMTYTDLLTQLRGCSPIEFGRGSKEALVAFGTAMTNLQQVVRIHDAQRRKNKQQEEDEWSNEGHTNWNPLEYPDWLLLEVDGDILLRGEQVDVALATASPQSDQNSVLQLQMGKGKTSCILPMAAVLLANRTDLARVVVPRALLLQTAQAMQAKLGGLVNRDLIHVPFSRRTPTTASLIQLYRNMLTQLRDRRGIFLTLPEHILSFKLSGLQQLCDGKLEAAAKMMETQRWLDQYSRDILDECDVSLAIRTQLIYPSGTQSTVDGHPMRWQVIQAVLHLVKDFSSTVQSRHPRSIEIVKRGIDGFPLMYFLRKDAEYDLLDLLVKIICKGQAPSILPCAEYPLSAREDLETYISSPNVRSHVVSRISDTFQDKPALMRTANLLRGLFVHRILLTTLKKRWNVQYGLHPTRVPIAVPYLAKGVPSPTAEWGHPDVAITLTCLSFYYEGLSMSQFKEAFEHLAKTDEPSIQYEKWFPKGWPIPRELDDYGAINPEDMRQLGELYQVVRYNASLVDFYLNNFVFPKYAKTFRLKLQASGWNLFPSVATKTKRTGARVTGFSGTNDSRHQLPLLIQQQDLPKLAHTNAEVAYYLLAPRNQSYVRMNFFNGTRWTEIDLMRNLARPYHHNHPHGQSKISHGTNYFLNPESNSNIRILIDAGAQVLEHSNRDFAKAWLDADHDAAAAVYFDDDHRVWVLYRTNKRIPLVASPFVDNLDKCVVYLDESHCRGTDLKFPPHARAALTLGQHLTKDALVQAAMRLRLLGQTQSVTFFSPPEVHQGILDRLKTDNDFYHPTSGDVLQWVFGQTCDIMEQCEPSFFAQTSHYLQQEQARLEHPDYLRYSSSRDTFLSKVRVKETLSLKQLYQPKGQRQNGTSKTITWHANLEGILKELQHRKKHFQDRGTAVHASALEEVEIEQEREAEREVEVEVEHVREVQQGLLFQAYKVKRLHEDVAHFATIGWLVAGSDAYRPMFSQLARTELGLKHTLNPSMKSSLWISAEFSRTVETVEANDNFIRPSQWILWSSLSQQALLVSPEEANELIRIIRQMGKRNIHINVHLIVYAAPVTRRMLHFNQLNYHAIPPLSADFSAPVWLRVELGLFSGRLYLEWDEYYELLSYLGISKDLSQNPEKPAFATKPLTFLHEWITLRRKGQDFEHTPMGFITTGKPLTDNHPFFRMLSNDEDPTLRPQIARHAPGYAEEEQDDDDHDDQADDEFVPAAEHVDDSEDEEDNGFDSSDDEQFVDAEDGE